MRCACSALAFCPAQAGTGFKDRADSYSSASIEAGSGFVIKHAEMSANSRLSTDRVHSAKTELMHAVRDAVNDAGLHRGEAEAMLSVLFCDLWNQTEAMLPGLPGDKAFNRSRRIAAPRS